MCSSMETTARATLWAGMGAEAINALYDLRWMIVLAAVLILADFWWGVSESLKNNVDFRFSRAGRRTCNKCVDYLSYLLLGTLIGLAICEPLDIATHTQTAAVGLGLGCLFEIDSIAGHICNIHGVKWSFSIKKLIIYMVKKKNNNIGTALEDAIINKEDNNNDSTDR